MVLHEILTGARPAQADVVLASASVKASDEDGRLPMEAPALRRALRGDLDNIIMRALSPEPLRRYASVAAFVEDIENYLDGRPVKAHPPSRWYLTAKFARRHAVAVALTLTLTVVVLLALGAALWQTQVARSQAQRAGEVQRFVETMFEPLESGNDNGSAPTLQELLQRGLERVDQRNPRDPQLRAELLAMFARINDGIGEVHGNVALAEAAWKANVEAWGEEDRRTLDVRFLLATVLRRDGQYERAFEEIEATRLAMQRAGIGGIAYALVLDSHLNARMSVSRVSNQEAVQLRREFIRLREADPAATPDDIAGGYNNLGDALEDLRDYAAAADAYQRAYELRFASLGDSASAAHSLANVGNTYSWRKQWRKAIEILDAARRMYDRAHITRHPNYAGLLIRLCHLRTLVEDMEGATADCAASLAMNEAVLGSDPGAYAMALVRDAGRALAAGDHVTAATGFARARALLAQGESGNGNDLRTTDIAEAARWRLLGEISTLRDRLQPIADMPAYADHWAAPVILAWLAQACEEAPAPVCGAQRRVAAEALLADPRFRDDPLRLPARTALARIDVRHGDRERATRELQQEITSAREIGPQHSWLGEAYLVLSSAQSNTRDARQSLTRARAIIDALPPGHPLHAMLIEYMAPRERDE